MTTLKEYINEMAVAKAGDYDFGNLSYIGNGETILSDKFYEKLTSFKYEGRDLSIGKYTAINNPQYYLLTERIYDKETQKDRNRVITAMDLEEIKKSGNYKKYKKLPYKNMAVVRGVETTKAERGKGYGFQMYKHLVNDIHFTIVGDQEQYDGARRLWKLLSKNTEFIVDIVDLRDGKIVEKDVSLKDALDPRIWTDELRMLIGSDEEKETGIYKRLVLTKVK